MPLKGCLKNHGCSYIDLKNYLISEVFINNTMIIVMKMNIIAEKLLILRNLLYKIVFKQSLSIQK